MNKYINKQDKLGKGVSAKIVNFWLAFFHIKVNEEL